MDVNKYFTPLWDIKSNLSKLPYLDLNRQSENHFGTYDVPTTLYLGVNRLSLLLNKDNLVPGAPIYIQAVDSFGYNVPFVVTDKQTSIGSRILNLTVYEETAPGPLTIYISSRCSRHPNTGVAIPYSEYVEAPNYKKIPNIVWTTVCMVKKELTKAPPVYLNYPSVTAYEYVRPYVEVSSQRQITKNFTGSLQYLPTTTRIEYTSDRSQTVRTLYDRVAYQIPYVSSSIITSPTSSRLLANAETPYLVSNLPIFSSDMEGAIVKMRPIWRDVPSNASDPSVFSGNTEIQATIQKVINNKRATLTNNIQSALSYVDVTGTTRTAYLKDFTSITSSITYNANPTFTTNDISASFKTKLVSVLKFNFKNLNPETGRVSNIEFQAKPFGASTPYVNIGPFALDTSYILTDSGSYEFTSQTGLQKKKIGNIYTQPDIEKYYYTRVFDKVALSDTYTPSSTVTASYSDTILINGLSLTQSYSDNQLIATTVKDEYLHNSLENTEYELKFNAHCTKVGSDVPKLEVYIQNPKVEVPERYSNNENLAGGSPTFGTLIGTVIGSQSSLFLERSFYFKTLDSSKKIKPFFVSRKGNWTFSEIDIKPSTRNGLSPNEAIVEFPLDRLPVKKANTEYIFKIKYLGEDRKNGNAESIISGMKIGSSYNFDADILINTIQSSSALQTAIFDIFTPDSASFASQINALTALTSSFAQILTASFSNTSSFTFQHNLDYLYPIVKVYDTQNEIFYPKDIQIVDNNTVKINFSSNESGILSVLSS